MKTLFPFVACAVALLPSLTRANDTAMGGRGANLVPLKTSDVFMASEDITLTLETERDQKRRRSSDTRPKWHVEARYLFVNPSNSAVELTFGFPEYRCEVDDPATSEACENQLEFHFEGMKTSVRGESVSHRKGKVDKRHAWAPVLGDVWLFDVTLAPGEEVPIVHDYRVVSSGDASGTLTADYVTRTGALWGRPIGRARFTFRYPARVCELDVPSQTKGDWDPIPFAEFRVVERGAQLLAEASYEVRNWTPESDVTFSLRTCTIVRDHFGIKPDALCPVHALLSRFIYGDREHEDSGQALPTREAVVQALEGLKDEQLRMCKNYPFAAYGRPFADVWLSESFYGAAKPTLSNRPLLPFVPTVHYTDKLLTADDTRWVKVVDEVMKKRSVAADPAVPLPSEQPSTQPQKPAPKPIAPPLPAMKSGCSGCTAPGSGQTGVGAHWAFALVVFALIGSRWRGRRRSK